MRKRRFFLKWILINAMNTSPSHEYHCQRQYSRTANGSDRLRPSMLVDVVLLASVFI